MNIEVPEGYVYKGTMLGSNAIIVSDLYNNKHYHYDGNTLTEITESNKVMVEGKKYDSGKIKAGMVFSYFAGALEEVCKVGTYGNEKYGDSFWDDNWNRVENAKERYTDALVRHLFKLMQGEIVDSESGHKHLSHAAWNVLALLELDK